MENRLLNLKENDKISVFEQKYHVISKTIYVTQNDDNEYIKYILSGHKILVIIPADNFMYLGEIVKQFEKGRKFSNNLKYNGKTFKKFASDYQIVKNVVFGKPQEVEGEVIWADYTCDENEDMYISCAYVAKTGKRADIVARIIDESDIVVE